MPLYEYHCEACGQDCELLVRDQPAVTCPECNSPRLVKRLSVPAAHSRSSSLPVCEPGGCGQIGCPPGMGPGQCPAFRE